MPRQQNSSVSQTIYTDRIKITNVDKQKDSGEYICTAYNLQGSIESVHQITVIGRDESVIRVEEPANQYKSEVSAGKTPSARWTVDVTGHPKPKSYWINNKNTEIVQSHNNKYEVTTTDEKSTLIIRNPDISDSGNYKLIAFNDKTSTNKTFTLIVRGMIL